MTRDALIQSMTKLGIPEHIVLFALESGPQNDTSGLARLCFIQWIWKECLISKSSIEKPSTPLRESCAEFEQKQEEARQALLKQGADVDAIYDWTRATQISLVLEMAAWLDGCIVHDYPFEVGLFEINKDGEPVQAISILDTFLDSDPEWTSTQ